MMKAQPRPMNARFWKRVRAECARRQGKDCHYPWCKCTPTMPAEEENPNAA